MKPANGIHSTNNASNPHETTRPQPTSTKISRRKGNIAHYIYMRPRKAGSKNDTFPAGHYVVLPSWPLTKYLSTLLVMIRCTPRCFRVNTHDVSYLRCDLFRIAHRSLGTVVCVQNTPYRRCGFIQNRTDWSHQSHGGVH